MAHADVQALLDRQTEPEGVVFDIETLEPNALPELADYVKQQIQILKQRYPDLDIAVVSHGAEEFALQKNAQSQNPDVHAVFRSLVDNDAVSVHVCGAVAGLKQLTKEDFPDFVSYSESGMAQINDYRALGYIIIGVRQLNDKQRKALFEAPQRYLK